MEKHFLNWIKKIESKLPSKSEILKGTFPNLLQVNKFAKLVNISAVLYDSDNGLNYDWTKSEYPFPKELIGQLKKDVLRRDFNLILQTKSDQVPNAKNDTLSKVCF